MFMDFWGRIKNILEIHYIRKKNVPNLVVQQILMENELYK